MKLNLGGNEEFEGGPGSKPLTGFTHVDIRKLPGISVVCDVTKELPFEDNSVDEIRASHIIEHVHPEQVRNTLAEWSRVLKLGGLLRVYCPNADRIAETFVQGNISITRFSELLFGAQSYDNQPGIVKTEDTLADIVNIHKAAYNKERLSILLETEGFEITGNEPRENSYFFDLGIQAIKK